MICYLTRSKNKGILILQIFFPTVLTQKTPFYTSKLGFPKSITYLLTIIQL